MNHTRLRHGCRKGRGYVHHQDGVGALSNESVAVGHTYSASLKILLNYSILISALQTPIVSQASTQTSLLSHQVYLTDRIDNKKRERMPHMKCVCFLQNSESSLEALVSELSEPKYGEYYLCQCVAALLAFPDMYL